MLNSMNWIKDSLVILAVTLLLTELTSFVASKNKLFLVNEVPLIYQSASVPSIDYGRTEFHPWGAWHVKNGVYRHKKNDCFDVKMHFNELGARDKSFDNIDSNSIFLLGDSFAEGYGVEYSQMAQTHLERATGREFLNFGSAGNFGPLQELLLYQNFQSLPHAGIVAFLLPNNDFQDNDQNYWSVRDRKRYRPYFSLGKNTLEPFYFPEAIPRESFFSNSLGAVSLLIKENFWTSNAIRSALMFARGQTDWKKEVRKAKRDTRGNYYNASPTQQSNIVSVYEKLAEVAGPKRDIVIVVIPSKGDVNQYNKLQDPMSYETMPWFKGLKDIDRKTENRVLVLDLMEYLPNDSADIFFSCDGHWSPKGNIWAANEIAAFLKREKVFQ